MGKGNEQKSYKKEYLFAQRIAKEVGKYALKQQKHAKVAIVKGERDFATLADVEVEKRIIAAIKETFPKDTVLAEETADKKEIPKDRLWIIDPIDGTTMYAHGAYNYCILVGFMDQGKMQVGVIYYPVMDQTIAAQRGKGAFCNNEPIHTSPEMDLKKCLVNTCPASSIMPSVDEALRKIQVLFPHIRAFLHYGACGLDFYRIAMGRINVYYSHRLYPWDAAAPSLILEEAGGVITNLDGTPFDMFAQKNGEWNVNFLAAANETIHKKVLDVITPKTKPKKTKSKTTPKKKK